MRTVDRVPFRSREVNDPFLLFAPKAEIIDVDIVAILNYLAFGVETNLVRLPSLGSPLRVSALGILFQCPPLRRRSKAVGDCVWPN
jgi:hypothetical protein